MHLTPKDMWGLDRVDAKGVVGLSFPRESQPWGTHIVLQTLKSNSARECFCSVSVGFSGSTEV